MSKNKSSENDVEDIFYHSGLQDLTTKTHGRIRRLKAESASAKQPSTRITFATRKYLPPLKIAVCTSVMWDEPQPMTWDEAAQTWHVELIGEFFDQHFEFKIRVGNTWMEGGNVAVQEGDQEIHLDDENVFLFHRIRFDTDQWHPNHEVTLRTDVDGWGRSLHGRYFSNKNGRGTWTFVLDRARFHDEHVEAKFLLDRLHFMQGDNLTLSLDSSETRFTDEQVDFGCTPTAYMHAYDNLIAEESIWEQRIVRPTTRPHKNKLHDVIVVGSGMAGGTLANALSNHGVDTLVLEAGGLGYPIHMNGLPRSEVNPVGRDEASSFFRIDNEFGGGLVFHLGGRSNYWSGLIPEMQPWEFRSGWPEVVKDYLLNANGSGRSGYQAANDLVKKQISLGPYQDKVVDHLNGSLTDKYVAENLPRSMHQPYLDEDGNLQNILRRSNGAFSTSDLLLESLGFRGKAGEKHLDLALHHLTTRIEPGDGQVIAHCQDLIANQPRQYRAKHLVLCCGCVESPRLAIQSGLSDPTNQMGRNLTDHPAYFYDRWHDLPNSGGLSWLGDVQGHAKVLLRSTNPHDEPYNIELLINASYWDSRFADHDLWNRSIARDAKVEIKFIFDSPLDPENYIETKGEGRKPWIRVKPNHHGQQYREKIVQARNTILKSLGIPDEELSSAWDDEEWRPGYNGSVQHAGGSMRMSDDGTGAVDENLRLLGYENIHCCDPSVFPSIPAANPSLTVVALALRLAKHLDSQLRA